VVTSAFDDFASGVQLSGFQPSRGTRIMNTPSIMKQK
jgi:hypothetical protein